MKLRMWKLSFGILALSTFCVLSPGCSDKSEDNKTNGGDSSISNASDSGGAGSDLTSNSDSNLNPPQDSAAGKTDAKGGTGPVDGKWETFGPALPNPALVNSLLMVGTTIYTSGLINGTTLKAYYLEGASGAWTLIPSLKYGSYGTYVPVAQFDGAIFLGMAEGNNSTDEKIYRKASGEKDFKPFPIGLHENVGGISAFVSQNNTLYAFIYKSWNDERLYTYTSGSSSFTKKAQQLPTFFTSRGGAMLSGARCFTFDGSYLYYSDSIEGPYTRINEAKAPKAWAGDGTNFVAFANGKLIYSKDNGKTFTEGKGGGELAIVADAGCFYASSQMGMSRSCDGGVNWDNTSDGAPKMGVYIKNPPHALFASGGYVYGAFGDQLYRYPAK